MANNMEEQEITIKANVVQTYPAVLKGNKGTVLEINTEKKRARVQFIGAKRWVNLDDLQLEQTKA